MDIRSHHELTGMLEEPWPDPEHGCCGGAEPELPSGSPSRRELLAYAGLSPLLATGFTRFETPGEIPRLERPDSVVRAALHVHSSFSEGAGALKAFGTPGQESASMESHAYSLSTMGFDLCMYTDHDHRMAGANWGATYVPYPTREDFANPGWTYSSQRYGSVAGGHNFGAGGLTVFNRNGLSGGVTLAYCDSGNKRWTYRTNLGGMTLALAAIAPETGYAEFRLQSSHRPATAGRPEGSYVLRYLLRTDVTERVTEVAGLTVIVSVPAQSGTTTVVPIDPCADLAAAYPDLGIRVHDMSAYGFWFGAGGGPECDNAALFQCLDIARTADVGAALALQRELLGHLQAGYPDIRLVQGLELSYAKHVNWLSNASTDITSTPPTGGSMSTYLRNSIAMIRAAGGASSYNHLFGATRGPLITGSARTGKIKTTATQLLANRLYGADILEVGYTLRGGMDLAAHLEVWDILLAAGMRVIANGATDNHNGSLSSYARDSNNFATDVLASTSDPALVIPALQQGRAFVSQHGKFGGLLDLSATGAVMGSTVTSPKSTVNVTVTHEGCSGMSVRVLQYAVHGSTTVNARRAPLKNVSINPGGRSTTALSFQNVNSYIRSEVWSGGKRVAFSNPLFIRRR